MSLRGALGFAEAVSPYREIASSGPRKNIGAGEQSPPRNDMPEQLRVLDAVALRLERAFVIY
jgi:hypothetical protein